MRSWCDNFRLLLISIRNRPSMVISLGPCWRGIDDRNGFHTDVRLSRDLFLQIQSFDKKAFMPKQLRFDSCTAY